MLPLFTFNKSTYFLNLNIEAENLALAQVIYVKKLNCSVLCQTEKIRVIKTGTLYFKAII